MLALASATLVAQTGLASAAGSANATGAVSGLSQSTFDALNAKHAKDPVPQGQDAAAFAQAKKTGKNVPIDRLTTEFTETVATPQGHYQLTSHPDQQRMKVGNQWQALDPTLKPKAGGGFAPADTPSGVVLSSGGGGPLATMTSKDGKTLALTAPFALPAPQVDGDSLTYPGVLGSDTDLKVTVGKSGSVSTVLVLKTAAAAANPALKTLHFDTTTDGVTVSTAADHTLSAAAADGKPRWSAPAPTMWDSSAAPGSPAAPQSRLAKSAAGSAAAADAPAAAQPSTTPSSPPATAPSAAPKAQDQDQSSADGPGQTAKISTMAVSSTSAGIDLTPDQNLLQTGKAPFYIDPTWIPWSGGSNGDASVQSLYHTAGNYNVNGPNDSDHLGVGLCGTYYPNGGACSGNSIYRTFYQFDTSALAGTVISSAHLDAWEYLSADWSCTTNYNVSLYWVNGAIGPGTNWDNQPQPFGGATSTIPVAGDGHTGCHDDIDEQFPISGSLLSGLSSNNMVTVGLRGDEGNPNGLKRFDYGASITVSYDRVPNAPTDPQVNPIPTSVTGGNTQACGTGWGTWGWLGAGTDANGAVTISTVVSSPASQQNQLQANILMWDYSANGAAPPGNTETPQTGQNGRATYTVPGGYIKDGHVYGYHFQTLDGVSGMGWSAFGPTCTFAVDETPPVVNLPSTVEDQYSEFPPSGDGQTTQLHVGQSGYIVAAATDPAPGPGLNSSGIACLQWGLDPNLKGSQWQCAGNLPALGPNGYKLPITPGHWGTNVEYIQARDNAGNISPIAQYPFYVPWNPAGPPPMLGDITGDGAPDMVTAGPDGSLRSYNVPGNQLATGPAVSVAAAPQQSPDGVSWADVHQLTHRGSLRKGLNVDDVLAHLDGDKNLYLYPNASTATGISGQLGPMVALPKPNCQVTVVTKNCATYHAGDWSTTQQIAATGDITIGTPKGWQTPLNPTGLLTTEVDGDGNTGLWFYPGAGSNALDPPIQLAASGWQGLHLMSPGDWANQGHPGFWAVDANGNISGYTLTVGQDSTLDQSGNPTGLYPAVTGISSPIALGWVDPTKYNVAALESDGDLNGSGSSGLWDVDKNNPTQSNLTTWFGTPIITNGAPTGYNWSTTEYHAGSISGSPEQWPFGITKVDNKGNVVLDASGNPVIQTDGSDTLGKNPLTANGTGTVTYGSDHPGNTPEKGSVTVSGGATLSTPTTPDANTAGLSAPGTLASGQEIDSATSRLVMQPDGNLVLYPDDEPNHALWASGTFNHPGATATLQSDGNFVVYDTNHTALWSSQTFGTTHLRVQDDRNMVVYDTTNKPLWTSNTYDATLNRPIPVAANGPVVDTSKSYSISAWVRINQDTGTDQAPICVQGDSRPSVSLTYRAASHSWGVYGTTSDDPNAGWPSAAAAGWTGAIGTWSHLAVTYSADTHTLSFYLNGYLAGSTALNTPWTANRALTIGGCYFDNDYTKLVDQFNGSVSDLRTYPFELTNQQVAALYDVPRQTVSLTSSNGAKCMDDNNAATADGTKVQVWDCNGSQAQKWSLGADGAVHILGKCLDGSAGTAGTKLQIWDCNSTSPQHFSPGPNGSLVFNGTNLCVDLPNGDTTDGNQLQLYGCNATGSQNWTLTTTTL
ncbi:ricin-type beta-trefoil lectin domain protein [Kitasatospora sp. LaBMicrA B282]|uniref:ricin-type beta-trefoil lectin domain protein n=1 Tax=Kitasatospora sp. LaBMicrA B282 TaxID=3420949 RepID=UPI003D1006B1